MRKPRKLKAKSSPICSEREVCQQCRSSLKDSMERDPNLRATRKEALLKKMRSSAKSHPKADAWITEDVLSTAAWAMAKLSGCSPNRQLEPRGFTCFPAWSSRSRCGRGRNHPWWWSEGVTKSLFCSASVSFPQVPSTQR